MKLMYAPPSPYARKARVTVLEKGLQDSVEFVLVNPMNDDPTLLSNNPLSKIPALQLDDGTSLIDSAQICEYLDGLATTNPLYGTGDQRQQILRTTYLANGILDAAVSARMELFRPEEIQWQPWVDRQRSAISRGLVQLEPLVEAFDETITIAQITAAAMLEYLDFRHADINWRDAHPALA
ncbi:MAG: glutathione S-transferase N-terminal domain-containing protein, partial [Immundisolibacteraceae bacterium]|nr:glutathione S-transferase N-terminal domain-containing protein [Immundisolibacteraceae bacterium]